jgi:hypothetical protein
VKLRGVHADSPRWVVLDEVGGSLTFHATQDEATRAARKRGDDAIVYVARIVLTNDPAQWRTK